MTDPFLKWVGGKRQLLPELRVRVPKKYGTYFEPFLGGGALFFDLEPERAVLSDINTRLVRTYCALQQDVEAVIYRLKHRRYAEAAYYAARERFNTPSAMRHDVDLAALFIYLNKTCFNGLYRENSWGAFNVPMGRYANPLICDATALRACACALKKAECVYAQFEATCAYAKRGVFVYLDPPYVPLSVTSDFTAYSKAPFGLAEQTTLRDCAWRLRERGVHVLLSNSASPIVLDLYQKFDIALVDAKRAVNSDASKRGKIKEAVIT